MTETAAYRRQRERMQQIHAAESKTGRDIGPVPDLANPRRRGRCRKSLLRFCETYNPEAFSLGWSRDHRRAIARIEEAVRHGALYCYAMPRGSGKTTLCRMAALWALAYGWRRYVYSIGANQGKAEDTLAAAKMYVRFLPRFVEDFPDISHAANALGGIAQRAHGQLCAGQPTFVEWSKDRLVLPSVPPPANWPRVWALRGDGLVPTAGSVLSASGLTGDGIRGSLLTLTTGESLRPDLVLLDDPQTSESSASPAQNASREQLIAADVLGMAGPGKTISALMACTVINQGDMVDCLLDRGKHPLWRGERTALLRTMPANLDAWEGYFEVYRRCALKEPPDLAEANAHYLAHRAALDAGAEASWPARKLDAEVSALQHAMHLYARDKRAFYAEYQNQPLPLVDPEPGELKADALAARLNQCPRGTAPAGSTRLTAFVDVQADLLYYAVCAWTEGFGGAVVDYGSYPDQRRPYYALVDANPTLAVATGIPSLDGSLYAGLGTLCDKLLAREWPLQNGGALKVEKCLIDCGWGMSTELVYKFCRQSPHAALILPSKGVGISASMNPVAEWPRKPGERRGWNWVIPAPDAGRGRRVLFDANGWKEFVAARLRQPLGEQGALTLFGDDAQAHRLFADHCTAEYRVKTFGRGREVTEWKQKPHRPDNHMWDALCGCAVAASVLGMVPGGVPVVERKPRPRLTMAELKARGTR